MLKTNFIDVIRSFSKEEMKNFSDFADSPYHNSSKAVSRFIELVKKYYPDFDNRNFTKEKIFSRVFSSDSYNDQVMRNLMSDALQLCYDFFVSESIRLDGNPRMRYILNELRKRNLDTLYDKNLKAAYKLVQKEHSLDYSYFENLYKLEGEVFLNEITHNRQEKVHPVVVRQGELLTYDYVSKLINHIIDVKVNERYYNISGSDTFTQKLFEELNMEPILDKLKSTSPKEHSALLIFYYRAMLSLNRKEADYRKFKKLFLDNTALFNRSTVYNLITTLETFCIDNIKSEPLKYRLELNEIHRKSIELDVLKLSKTGPLNMLKYWNIFINSVEIDQIEWAEEFAEKHHGELDPEIREGAISFARAIVLYKRKDYEKALEVLSRTKLSQFLFRLSIKTFYLRIYFEKGDYQSAGFALDSYKQFLYKNKSVSDSYRTLYLNFAAMYYELLKMRSGEKKPDANELKSRIDALTPNLHSRQWLLEMAEQL